MARTAILERWPRSDRSHRVAAIALVWLAALLGCNDSTAPGSAPSLGNTVHPTTATFVLDRLRLPGAGADDASVELIGSNLRVDRVTEHVSIDVAIRNGGDALPFRIPAALAVGCFQPNTVALLNADAVSQQPGCRNWLFRYDRAFGDDGVLLPGETSAPRTWLFHDPGIVSFAFSVEAHIGTPLDGAHIAGTVFVDENRNGVRDPLEWPVVGMEVAVGMPQQGRTMAVTDSTGSYSVPIAQSGLYDVAIDDSRDARVCTTTPNPLRIVVVELPGGGLQSYDDAHIGIVLSPCEAPVQPVVLVDSLANLRRASYSLRDARLEGDRFTLRVGYSGCAPVHSFILYAARGFAESNPVQKTMILRHENRSGPCDAYFEETLRFDLEPIRQEFLRSYRPPVHVRLWFVDYIGNRHEFLLTD